MRKTKKHPTGPVRILTDLTTSEWFWATTDDDGNLSFTDQDAYDSETSARDAAAADHGVEPADLERAEKT